MTTYAPKAVTLDGVAPTSINAAAGDKLSSPGDRVWITVKNGSGASVTLTINPSGKTVYGVTNPAKIFTIPAGGELDIPMLREYGDPADNGNVAFTWSAITTVTWSAKRI